MERFCPLTFTTLVAALRLRPILCNMLQTLIAAAMILEGQTVFWDWTMDSPSRRFLNVNLDLSCWLREVGSVLSTLVFTRQCTAGATVEALDNTRCQLIHAKQVLSRSSSSGTVFDSRRMTREKIPREQYGSNKPRIDYQGRGDSFTASLAY